MALTSASSVSGSRATAMNSSSSVCLAVLAAAASRGSPSSRILPVRQEQHAVAHLLHLVHVVRGPQHAARSRPANSRIRARMSRAVAGSSDAVGSSSSSRLRPVEHRLGQADARLLAGGQHAALACRGSAPDRTAPAAPRCARRRSAHAVDQAEDAQVLLRRSGCRAAARRRRRNSCAPAPRGAGCAMSTPSMRIVPGGRLEHAEDHVDGRGLAGAVRPQQPDDLAMRHVKLTSSTALTPAYCLHRSVTCRAGTGNGSVRRPGRDIRHYTRATQADRNDS